MQYTLNVYDENNEVVKTVEATDLTIKFGTIRSLMKLLNIDDIDDTANLLKVVYDAWEELTKILNQCFPDMEENDWDNVRLDELVPTVINILKGSFSSILTIPNNNTKN